MVYPPSQMKGLPDRKVDVTFLLDVSGSMTGRPFEQCRSAVSRALDRMSDGDTVQVVRFASSSDQVFSKPEPATHENRKRALKFLEQTEAGGGTMMLTGLTQALQQPSDPDRVSYICLLTDGFIGNETDLIRATAQLRNNKRVFGIGVGSAPNRYLLDGMSVAGAGAVAYFSPTTSGEEVMDGFFQRVRKSALTNIQLDLGQQPITDVLPEKIPDLYVGRPVTMVGRYRGEAPHSIALSGRMGDQVVRQEIPVTLVAEDGIAPSLRTIWARQKIGDLAYRSAIENSDASAQIRETALRYNLMSAYTAFVAVDSLTQTTGESTSVVVPVPVPEGTDFHRTVGGGN